MTFVESIKHVFGNYANFSGRASRSEYWWFALGVYIIGVVYMCIAGFNVQEWSAGAYTIYGLIYLVLILPSLAVSVRRMHDTGRGGGWIFIALVPLIGQIWYLVLMLLPGQPTANRFGSVPA